LSAQLKGAPEPQGSSAPIFLPAPSLVLSTPQTVLVAAALCPLGGGVNLPLQHCALPCAEATGTRLSYTFVYCTYEGV